MKHEHDADTLTLIIRKNNIMNVTTFFGVVGGGHRKTSLIRSVRAMFKCQLLLWGEFHN